jgi:hypothetical protein
VIFLTGGGKWLGPYSSQLPGDIARGQRWLREVEGAADVHVVYADTIEQARRKFGGRHRKR